MVKFAKKSFISLWHFILVHTPFTRESIHEENVKQTYSKYMRTTCARSLPHVCYSFASCLLHHLACMIVWWASKSFNAITLSYFQRMSSDITCQVTSYNIYRSCFSTDFQSHPRSMLFFLYLSCHFLLMINCNLGFISHRFRYGNSFSLKTHIVLTPSVQPQFWICFPSTEIVHV